MGAAQRKGLGLSNEKQAAEQEVALLTTTLTTILNALETERDTVIELQRLLVSTPALSPENNGQGERAKADRLKSYIAGLGLAPVVERNAPDARVPCGHRPNLALVMPGKDTSRTLWVIAHLDVVPVGERALWHSDPFELVVQDDFVRGRGVEDNHQGLVSGVLVAKALAEHKAMPAMNYGLLFVADEETGSAYGLDYLVQHHADMFGQRDLILVPDFGVPDGDLVEIAEKSILWLKVTVHGVQCHGSTPHKGVNSLIAASDFIMRVAELAKRFDAINPLFDPPQSTFVPTKKEANVENVNTVPGRDVFYLDCRVLPQYDLGEVMEEIRKVGQAVEATHGVRVEYEAVQYKQAAPATASSDEVVRKLMQAIQAVRGIAPRAIGVGGGTVAAYLRAAGHPVAVWSTQEGNNHEVNERSSIAKTINDAKVMAYMALSETVGA